VSELREIVCYFQKNVERTSRTIQKIGFGFDFVVDGGGERWGAKKIGRAF